MKSSVDSSESRSLVFDKRRINRTSTKSRLDNFNLSSLSKRRTLIVLFPTAPLRQRQRCSSPISISPLNIRVGIAVMQSNRHSTRFGMNSSSSSISSFRTSTIRKATSRERFALRQFIVQRREKTFSGEFSSLHEACSMLREPYSNDSHLRSEIT